MSKKEILTSENLSGESKELFDLLNNEKDIACIMIGCSFLDQCLATLLKNFFIKSSKADEVLNGLLHTFHSRIEISYFLGLINKNIYEDLKYLKIIRNEFAHHHLKYNFNDPEIRKLSEKLKYIEPKISEKLSKRILPRGKINMTIAQISQVLIITSLSTEHRKENENYRI